MQEKTPTPAAFFLGFFAVLALALLVAAVAAPWVQAALSPLGSFPLHRVYTRIVMLVVIIAAFTLLRRYGLVRRDLVGFPGGGFWFWRQLGTGLAGGIGLMALAIVPLFLLGLRTRSPAVEALLPTVLLLLPKAVLTGIAVSLIEETFFRGAMQGAMSQGHSRLGAFLAIPALYAAVHFFGESIRVPHEQVEWHSGFIILGGYFRNFLEPLAIADAFLALYLVGVLLALVRERTGGIAACIGLHAGFVAVIKLMRQNSVAVPESPLTWLAGSFDGLLGLWIALVSGLACLVAWRWLPGRSGAVRAA
ncbi:MAG: hypothetical protein RL026_825 [Pseudomonadota bacterium]